MRKPRLSKFQWIAQSHVASQLGQDLMLISLALEPVNHCVLWSLYNPHEQFCLCLHTSSDREFITSQGGLLWLHTAVTARIFFHAWQSLWWFRPHKDLNSLKAQAGGRLKTGEYRKQTFSLYLPSPQALWIHFLWHANTFSSNGDRSRIFPWLVLFQLRREWVSRHSYSWESRTYAALIVLIGGQ